MASRITLMLPTSSPTIYGRLYGINEFNSPHPSKHLFAHPKVPVAVAFKFNIPQVGDDTAFIHHLNQKMYSTTTAKKNSSQLASQTLSKNTPYQHSSTSLSLMPEIADPLRKSHGVSIPKILFSRQTACSPRN